MKGRENVWDAVEAFRREHLAAQTDPIPVDVFSLVELELRLDVIPFDDLSAKYQVDAALKPDFTGTKAGKIPAPRAGGLAGGFFGSGGCPSRSRRLCPWCDCREGQSCWQVRAYN